MSENEGLPGEHVGATGASRGRELTPAAAADCAQTSSWGCWGLVALTPPHRPRPNRHHRCLQLCDPSGLETRNESAPGLTHEIRLLRPCVGSVPSAGWGRCHTVRALHLAELGGSSPACHTYL